MSIQITKNKSANLINTLLIIVFNLLISLGSLLFFNSLSYADTIAAIENSGSAPTGELPATPYQFIFQTVQFFLFGFFIYYMLVLRPQQLNEENQSRFLKSLKKDDEVQTSGGILGKVVTIAEEFITVEVASGVKLKVLKSHIKALKQKEVAVKK